MRYEFGQRDLRGKRVAIEDVVLSQIRERVPSTLRELEGEWRFDSITQSASLKITGYTLEQKRKDIFKVRKLKFLLEMTKELILRMDNNRLNPFLEDVLIREPARGIRERMANLDTPPGKVIDFIVREEGPLSEHEGELRGWGENCELP